MMDFDAQSINFEAWQVDFSSSQVKHASGFVINFEGDPADPSEVNPKNFPSQLNFIDQAKLLRCGLEFLAKAAASGGSFARKPIDIESLKSDAVKEREALAKHFAERADKPQRAQLSLKKKD